MFKKISTLSGVFYAVKMNGWFTGAWAPRYVVGALVARDVHTSTIMVQSALNSRLKRTNTCSLREATRDKKQLDFGFLLNRLDPPPVSLDMFEELFFPASYQAGKSSSKSLDFGQAPPFSWKMSKL